MTKQNVSDSRSKRKSCSRFAVRSVRVARGARVHEKSCRIQNEPCSSILRIQLRLIFDYHSLNRATLRWARVVNAYLLTGSQRRCHHFASGVNDSCGRAKREANRSLIAPNHNGLAGLIGSYCACGISRACGRLSRSCRFVGCCRFLGCGRAGLRKS